MNERIKELSNRAWESITVQDALDDEAFDSFDQKFAELIVRECLNIAKNVNRNPYLPDGEQARQIIKDITKHFGVEE